MSQSALVPVQFHGASLITTIIDGVPHVALRPICDAIGVDWQAQHARIKRHPVLSICVSVTKTQMPGDDQARDVFMLPLDKLNGWLFGVSVNRVRPELREKLTQYQAECFDVLAQHFGAATKPPVSEIPMQDKTNAALEAANAVAAQVQAAVFKALMAGGKSWQHERWMLSFIVNGRDESVKPHAEQIESDAVVMPLPRLATSIRKEGDMLVSNAELANLASACSTRLAQRMQVATS